MLGCGEVALGLYAYVVNYQHYSCIDIGCSAWEFTRLIGFDRSRSAKASSLGPHLSATLGRFGSSVTGRIRQESVVGAVNNRCELFSGGVGGPGSRVRNGLLIDWPGGARRCQRLFIRLC